MSNKIFFTKEQKADIAEMYKQGMSLAEIQRRHDIHSPSTVYTVLKDMGIEWETYNSKSSHKKCSCGNKNPKNARYCCMCGHILLTDEEIIIENLLKARATATQFVPSNKTEEVDQQIMEAVKLLKIKCKVK
jgi:hypothetical protein